MWIDVKYITLLSNNLHQFKQKNNVYNFRCPYCGDSQKNKFKARGYLYNKKGEYIYYCHNCGASKSFDKFIQDNAPQLYKEYKLETMKEAGNLKSPDHIDIIIPKIKSTFPSYLRSGSPLRKLKKISQLKWDHPAKEYISKRSIPNLYHSKLFYCPKFYQWTNSIIPNKFKKVTKDEPRLIIPFIDEQKQFFGYQGRSFQQDSQYRYITIMLDESKPKVFGLDSVDVGKTVYITEGPLDSCFVNNCIAMAGSDIQIKFDDVVMIYDNEPRSIQIVKKMQKAINKQNKIVVWPTNLVYKDINDMIISGYSEADIELLIDQNTYSDLQADMALVNWKRC
jgi:hypothetical protein